jgi:predicted nuclease of predicted toxin-antitoxin system
MHMLLDHNVPDSVAVVFREFGHTVYLVREILPTDSPDPLIAAVADRDGYILVSCDKDFDKIAPRIPIGSKTRFRKLNRISLDCSEAQAAKRVRATMRYIELAFTTTQLEGKRLRIVIQNAGFKIIE